MEEEKMMMTQHTLIAHMENKPGVLNRVSGLFRRRNYNIEALSVGHSETPGISRMTIVVNGDNRIVEQVVKQLCKLVNVTEVADVSEQPSVIRELALIKVNARPGTRMEIIELVKVFHGRIVDVGSEALTVEVTGPEERVNSLVRLLQPFGIKELARTGRMAMVRSDEGKEPLLQA
jgi:acetolactate synthase-1/3 small subunit